MKFTKLDLLTLLISLFLFGACKNSNTIGLDVDPANEIKGTLTDTITVRSKTVADDVTYTWIDPTAGTNLVRYPFGYMTDAIFGPSESNLSMTVTLPNSTYGFGNNPVLDSAVLVLPYSSQFYGDTTTSRYSVEVHQLTTDLTTLTNFKSTQEYPYSTTLLGSFTGRIKPTTSFQIKDIVSGAADTLKTVVPQMRIPLSTSFIQSAIVNLDSTKLTNTPTFAAIFKGLRVSLNRTNSTGTGGIMFFDLTGTNSRIELYYKRNNATTPTNRDTIATTLPIVSGSYPVAATIKHTYPVALANEIADNSNKQYDVTYLQGLGGLRNKISFPYLQKFYDNFGVKAGTRIIINKAELVVDLSSGTDAAPYFAAPRLSLYRYDIAGRRINLPDNSSTDSRYSPYFGGYYDLVNKRYTFLVTAYLQDLLDGKTTDYGTYLSTSSSSEFDLTPPLTSAARSVIGSKKNTTNKIRLNVFYTVIN